MKRAILILIIGATTTSCGVFVPNSQRLPELEAQNLEENYTGDLATFEFEGEFRCPIEPNVLPNSDLVSEEARTYQACTHMERNDTIRLHGTTESSSYVCVFPIERLPNGNYIAKFDIATSSIYRVCTDLADRDDGEQGADFTFPATQFHGVFVTEGQQDEANMAACLYQNNSDLCPEYYSKGVIR